MPTILLSATSAWPTALAWLIWLSPLGLLVLAFFTGRNFRRRQLASIQKREAALRHIQVIAVKRPPAAFTQQQLVSGCVVVSSDYFTRMLAFFHNLIGGRMGSHETLMLLARREALLRMKEQAAQLGAEAVLNVKISTSALDDIHQPNSGTHGTVEVLAYGTAGKIQCPPAN